MLVGWAGGPRASFIFRLGEFVGSCVTDLAGTLFLSLVLLSAWDTSGMGYDFINEREMAEEVGDCHGLDRNEHWFMQNSPCANGSRTIT